MGNFAGDTSQRVHAILSSAETEASGLVRDAEREGELVRREAQVEAEAILEDARRRADELVAERVQLLSTLSDGIIERTEMLFDRIDAAGHVKRQIDDLLRTLGETAETVAREAGTRRAAPRPAPRVATTPRTPAPAPRAPSVPRTPSVHTPRPAAAPVQPVTPAPAPVPPPRAPEPAPQPAAQVRRPEPVPSPQEAPRRVDDKTDARFDGARLVALQMAVAGSTREEVHSELQRAFRLADPSSILDDVFGGPRRAGAAS